MNNSYHGYGAVQNDGLESTKGHCMVNDTNLQVATLCYLHPLHVIHND